MATAAEDSVTLLQDQDARDDEGFTSDADADHSPATRSPDKGQDGNPHSTDGTPSGDGEEQATARLSPDKTSAPSSPKADGCDQEQAGSPKGHDERPSVSPKGAAAQGQSRSPTREAGQNVDQNGSSEQIDEGSNRAAPPGQEGPECAPAVQADSGPSPRQRPGWQSKQPPATTIASQLYGWYTATPKRRAFVFVREGEKKKKSRGVVNTVTCSELYSLAVRCAHYLITSYSVRPRDVVCNTLPTSLDRLVVDLAVILAGGVLLDAPRQPDTEDAALKFCTYLRPLNVKVLVCAGSDPLHAIFSQQASEADALMCWIYGVEDCGDSGRDLLSLLSQEYAVSLEEAETFLPDMSPDDKAVMWTTRGRGCQARVVVQDHRAVLEMGRQFQAHLLALTRRDVYFCSADLGGMFGFPAVFLETGVTTLMEDKMPCPSIWDLDHFESARLQPPISFNTLVEQNCTKAFFTTHHLEYYWDNRQLEIKGGGKLKRVAVSGDLVKSMLVQQLHEHVAKEVVVAYCMAELGLVAYSEQPRKPFKQSDLMTIVDTLTLKPRSVPDGKEAQAGQAGTLDITTNTKRLQLFVDPLPDNSGDKFVFQETDVIHTDDFGAVCEGRLKLAGRIDREALLPDHPNFIRERTEFNLRLTDTISDAVVLVYEEPDQQKTLVACLSMEPNITGGPLYSPDSARYSCQQHMIQIRCWKPEEYWIFGVFPKTPLGFVDRSQIRTMVDRARRQQLPYDWHYQQRQGALGPVVVKPSYSCPCCCIL